jgi:hypothetical protein
MNIELKEIVEKYLAAAGGYGKQIPLTSLGLSKEEIEDVFSTFDEDYHISRFLHFACAAGADFQINGFPQTHVAIDEEVQSIL